MDERALPNPPYSRRCAPGALESPRGKKDAESARRRGSGPVEQRMKAPAKRAMAEGPRLTQLRGDSSVPGTHPREYGGFLSPLGVAAGAMKWGSCPHSRMSAEQTLGCEGLRRGDRSRHAREGANWDGLRLGFGRRGSGMDAACRIEKNGRRRVPLSRPAVYRRTWGQEALQCRLSDSTPSTMDAKRASAKGEPPTRPNSTQAHPRCNLGPRDRLS